MEEGGGDGGNREECVWGGGVMSTALMQCTWLEYFQLEFWLDPQGKSVTSLCLLFLFPCDKSFRFPDSIYCCGTSNASKTSHRSAACRCANSDAHFHIFVFLCICLCSLYLSMPFESDIINTVCFCPIAVCNLNTWGRETTCAHVEE